MVENIDEVRSVPTNSKNLISIIIPVYNGGDYLKPMLDSIYLQTYTNIEVIVAYDTKSSDTSLDILKEYSKKYGLIIDQDDDTSSGTARNRGFQLAKGEFVIFFDGDDLVTPTYLEDLMAVFIKNPGLDAVCGNFLQAQEYNIDKVFKSGVSSKSSSIVYNLDEALERWLPAKKYIRNERIFTAPWTWLVRKKYLLEYNILFPDYSFGDDHIYTGRILVNSQKIGYTTKKGYIWIMHNTSILHKYKPYDECYAREQKFLDDMVLLLEEKHPDILARFRKARKILFDKGYIMRLWDLPYSEFILKLKEKKLMHLGYSESESFSAHMSTFCFNYFKWFYLFVHKRIRHDW